MEIRIDRDKCVSGGVCAMFAPQVFDQDDEGMGVVDNSAPAEELAAAVRSVVWRCPGHAISVHEREAERGGSR
ncbi:ferredoxin [Streptomyces chartreusis]|uniref:ferredoxin n=1 Tax=Streptomyces chartreusis TaxID=1969 RepID=UPI000D3C4C13|nr:ferredoxin [Streptomyces chartreusis]